MGGLRDASGGLEKAVEQYFCMPVSIHFIERKFDEFVSIEKVFRLIEKGLDKEKFAASFQQLPFLSNLSGTIKNLLYFRRHAADVYHVTGHVHYIALILPRRKTVLTIHDLRFLRDRRGLRGYVLKKLLLDFPVKRLNYITAISEATKKEILARTNCRADKILVIENPLDEYFRADDKKEFDTENPNILQIGTAANKNLPNLIRAVKNLNCRLTIVGRLDAETESLLREKGVSFENKFGLDAESMKDEYRKADLVAFCSLYEGFGLPIIEAQAMRTPVLTSDISPLREVAGGGALLVDPNDYKSIEAGILRIVGDRLLRGNLQKKGLENIERFRPRAIAAKYEALYAEVVSRATSG